MNKYYTFLFFLFIPTYIFSQNPCPGTVDYAGKTYNTVQIGTQCWLKENLDLGTRINAVDTAKNNGIIEKYCYNNDTANCTFYGGLYTWDEAMQYTITPKTKGICPTGWHIPSYDELQTLATNVNNDGNKLKAIGQGTGTNTSGFSALLAGTRTSAGMGSIYGSLGGWGFFWSSTQYTSTSSYRTILDGADSIIYLSDKGKDYGFSVRCLKDDATGINDHTNNTSPNSIELLQNYPNPFNPTTTISFTLPERSLVVLSIYNELGQKVAELFNGDKPAGSHSIEWNAGKFVSGVYFYELKTDKFTLTKKLILMK